MFTFLTRFLFISAFFASLITSAFAENSTAPQQQANTQLPEWFYRELSSIQKEMSDIDANGATKESVQELKERIGILETEVKFSGLRIGDIYASTDRFGIIAGILGAIIAVMSFLFSWNAKKEAIENAKEEAAKLTSEWIENEEKNISNQFDNQIHDINQRFDEEIKGLSATYDSKLQAKLAELEQKHSDNLANIQQNMSLQQDAAALLGKAFTLFKSGRLDEAIDIYDQLDQQFKHNQGISIEKQVAEAKLNKGLVLIQLNRLEAAISEFNEFDQRYKSRKELVIEGLCTKALINKGIALGRLKLMKEAIEAFNELNKRFKNRNESVLKHALITALSNKAEFILISQNKKAAKFAIQEALSLIADDHKQELAVMELLSFIIDESTIETVFTFIKNIPDEEELAWGFKELREKIASLESPKKEQVEAVARFFEEHKNKAKLKEELDNISKK